MKALAEQALHQIAASGLAGRIWDAHWGCAVLAGALLLEQELVGDEARPVLNSLLEQIILTHPGFEKRQSEPGLQMDGKVFSERLLSFLTMRGSEGLALGHDVIFAAYILRSVERFQIVPSAFLFESTRLLIGQTWDSGPGWITINGHNDFLPLGEPAAPTGQDYWTLFVEFDRPRSMEAGDMQLGHVLTHGHALHMLPPAPAGQPTLELGYRKRLGTIRAVSLRERDQTPLPHRRFDPRTKVYWDLVPRLGDMHGHALKYAYSFLELRPNPSDADLAAFSRIVWPTALLP